MVGGEQSWKRPSKANELESLPSTEMIPLSSGDPSLAPNPIKYHFKSIHSVTGCLINPFESSVDGGLQFAHPSHRFVRLSLPFGHVLIWFVIDIPINVCAKSLSLQFALAFQFMPTDQCFISEPRWSLPCFYRVSFISGPNHICPLLDRWLSRWCLSIFVMLQLDHLTWSLLRCALVPRHVHPDRHCLPVSIYTPTTLHRLNMDYFVGRLLVA